jgi:hypothetical protein
LLWLPALSLKSRGSPVGNVTGYGLEERRGGFRVAVGSRILTLYLSGRLWGHLASSPMGTGDYYTWGKMAGA